MKQIIFAVSVFLLIGGCGARQASVEDKYVHHSLNPNDVPEKIVLNNPIPVLVLTFSVTDEGYTLEKGTETLGVPTQTTDQTRDVMIIARSPSGETISTVSVFNPREIHTAGSDNPEKAVLEKGTVTVALPKPEEIKHIDIQVIRGPNADLKKSFDMDKYKIQKKMR